jgi:hypothetical protein
VKHLLKAKDFVLLLFSLELNVLLLFGLSDIF